ncbi:hypothetical protein FIBSPDRAFT_939762 [Athelia psychrophila]|uniref:Uncharacterized protein n=1 Tax=Athelia psychrophila TaxID=1759441 RepID=A0A167X8F9_9AGAM|nr:hypothetical protein FIBSPDRAFT_939762 [Fibularhizoctonia sp. CBS 109695]
MTTFVTICATWDEMSRHVTPVISRDATVYDVPGRQVGYHLPLPQASGPAREVQVGAETGSSSDSLQISLWTGIGCNTPAINVFAPSVSARVLIMSNIGQRNQIEDSGRSTLIDPPSAARSDQPGPVALATNPSSPRTFQTYQIEGKEKGAVLKTIVDRQ